MGATFLVLASTVAVIAILVLYSCIYRIFSHAFADIPGPFLAKLTNAYSAYHAAKRDTHVVIQRLHEKHGRRSCMPRAHCSDFYKYYCRSCGALWAGENFIQHSRIIGR